MEKETYILGVNNWYELKQNSWSGAIQTLNAIEEKGLEDDFLNLINSLLSETEEKWTDTQLNDFIWFDTEYIEEYLNTKLWEDE